MRVCIAAVSIVLVLFSCGENQSQQQPKVQGYSKKELKQKIAEANKMYLKRESDEIEQYIKLRGWSMQTTGTGLRYMVLKQGKGKPALPDTEVTIKYKVSLLDGTPCYSSEQSGPRTFLVEKDNIESGLHEGIQYLHEGDKALLILPSHLAHGLLGDEDKIPSHSTVVYELELISVH